MELDDIVVGDTYIEGNIVGDSPQPAIKQATYLTKYYALTAINPSHGL